MLGDNCVNTYCGNNYVSMLAVTIKANQPCFLVIFTDLGRTIKSYVGNRTQDEHGLYRPGRQTQDGKYTLRVLKEKILNKIK